MYETSFVQQAESVKKLLSKHPDQGCAEASKLVLFDQFVEIDAQQFENQAKMLSMNESIFQSKKMVVVVLIELCIKLGLD